MITMEAHKVWPFILKQAEENAFHGKTPFDKRALEMVSQYRNCPSALTAFRVPRWRDFHKNVDLKPQDRWLQELEEAFARGIRCQDVTKAKNAYLAIIIRASEIEQYNLDAFCRGEQPKVDMFVGDPPTGCEW